MFEGLKPWLDLVQWVFTVALGLFVWLRKPGEDAGAAVATLRADHDQRLHQHAARLTEIEAHMEHMPTSEELKELEGTVREIGQRTAGIADSMTTMRATLARIETYLLHSRLPGNQQ
jgi:hypothetical protein